MIILIVTSFLLLSVSLSLLMSFEIRSRVQFFAHQIHIKTRYLLQHLLGFAIQMDQATSRQKTQTHWHLQQWWVLITGFSLLFSIIMIALFKPVSQLKIEADYLKKTDPQIYSLLNGEILTPPPEEDERLMDAEIIAAMQIEQSYRQQSPVMHSSLIVPDNSEPHHHFDSTAIDRKWQRMHPRYKQRLLMVFKTMKERHGYDLVLLEGYRSPERQNKLSGNIHTTRARAFQSYHQFGLAADVAFKRSGKVIISERDPWAMQGYRLYGEVAESVGLTWGGRWTSIQDYGHTEYRMPGLRKTQEMAKKLIAEAETGLMNDLT
jgi:peptidoglycan L-alanyl-D-glutamate endopeptidase CwlK